MHFHFIAIAALGKGLSGGDRIFIELSRRIQRKGHKVTIYVWEEGYQMCRNQKLYNVKFVIWKVGIFRNLGFIVTYVIRILSSVIHSLFLKLENSKNMIVYSASDFWMDSLPGWILKIRFPKITWIGTYYLAAPNPFYGFKEGGEKKIPKFGEIIYWLIQKIPYFLIRNFADIVCVTSEPDIDRFPQHKNKGNFLVIKGGVNLKGENYSIYPNKLYSAVFQGRFHKQKGVIELMEIWRKVVDRIPNAKLAMIGNGPLYKSVQEKIMELRLRKNVVLLGYIFDGPKKDGVFKKSKIVVHPAIYDSGGMAPAEAMVYGLPGVSFDLLALRSYYPQGLLKAKLGDLEDFSNKIIILLENKQLYNKISSLALRMIKSEWSWEHRTDQFLDKIDEVTKRKHD